jgi:broad specificity phosphatase PhoE
LTSAGSTAAAAHGARPSSRLWLIRHAQASFGSADYDQLSERGEQQAQRLAGWLTADPDLQFAHVVCGTLRRHVQTRAAAGGAGRGLE